MTPSEALTYAIDWLRAFPALPTAKLGYAEERAEVIRVLSAMLPRPPAIVPEEDKLALAATCLGCFHLNAECVCE